MPRLVDVIPRIERQGRIILPEFRVPLGYTHCGIYVERGDVGRPWPVRDGLIGRDGEVLRASVEFSLDDGATWIPRGGMGTHGGLVVGRVGLVGESWLEMWLPGEEVFDRLLRIMLDFIDPLITKLDLGWDARTRPPTSKATRNTVGYTASEDNAAGAASSVQSAAFTPSGDNRVLLVGGFNEGTPQAFTSFSSTQGGSFGDTQNNVFNTFLRAVASRQIAPVAGSTQITYTIAANDLGISVGAVAYDSVDQTTPLGLWNFSSGTGNNPSRSHQSIVGARVAQMAWCDAATITVSGAGTSRNEFENFGADGFSQGLSDAAGADLVTLGWTATVGGYGWGMYTVNVNDVTPQKLAIACGTVILTTGAVNTTFSVETPGFQPSAVVLCWNGRATLGTAEADANFGIGLFTGTAARRAYNAQLDHAVTANNNRDTVWRNDACVVTLDTAAALGGLADVDAIFANGFRLIIDDQFPAALVVGWLAVGGTDIANVAVVDWTERATNGDTDVATGFALNTGIDDKAVIAVGIRSTAASGTAASDSAISLGIAAGNSIAQATAGMSGDDATDPSLTCGYGISGQLVSLLGNDVVVTRNRVSSWLADGFRVTTDETDGSAYRYSALVIKGGRWEVGNFLTRTDTTKTDEATTYVPKGLLALSAVRAESTSDTTTAGAELSVGAAAGANARWASLIRDADASAAADVGHSLVDTAFYTNIAATAATVDGLCDLVDFVPASGNGFTFVMDDADPAQSFVAYLVGAEAPAASFDAALMQAIVPRLDVARRLPRVSASGLKPSDLINQ